MYYCSSVDGMLIFSNIEDRHRYANKCNRNMLMSDIESHTPVKFALVCNLLFVWTEIDDRRRAIGIIRRLYYYFLQEKHITYKKLGEDSDNECRWSDLFSSISLYNILTGEKWNAHWNKLSIRTWLGRWMCCKYRLVNRMRLVSFKISGHRNCHVILDFWFSGKRISICSFNIPGLRGLLNFS